MEFMDVLQVPSQPVAELPLGQRAELRRPSAKRFSKDFFWHCRRSESNSYTRQAVDQLGAGMLVVGMVTLEVLT